MKNLEKTNLKTKPFSRTRAILSLFLGNDIEDGSSTLEAYIEKNVQTGEDIENQKIAKELKDSLDSLDTKILVDVSKPKHTRTKKNSITNSNEKGSRISTISLQSNPKEITKNRTDIDLTL